MQNVLVETLKAGDVIMPPARELRLWMRRALAERNLPESALHLTVTEIQEGSPDKRGRWLIVKANQAPEWFQQCKPYPFIFKARPGTPWPKIESARAQRSGTFGT